MKGTEDELQFGDMIELNFTKDLPDGGVSHHHLECKFIPELVPMLLEDGIIEEHLVKTETSDTTKEGSLMTQEVIKTIEALELRMDKLEDIMSNLHQIVLSLTAKLHKRNARKQN